MKKIIIFLSLLFIPVFAFASIDKNLYYGLQKNSDVTQLQEFLIDKGFLTGNATGNFFSLTLKAVKAYQASASISPTGYVGALTRKAINDELAANLSASNQEATTETGSTSPVIEPTQTLNDVVKSLQAQIALLTQQLAAMQSQSNDQQQQQTTLNQIQQNTQQIVQNTTCAPNWQCSNWNSCANSRQSRTCVDTKKCGVLTGKPIELQPCNCTSNWQCGDWSSCMNSQQTRTCNDSNNCGVTINKPTEIQSCAMACVPNWQCSLWTSCLNGQTGRTCNDSNNCGVTTGKPNETESCTIDNTLSLFERYNSGDNDVNSVVDPKWESQTFTPQTSHVIKKVRIKIYRLGLPGIVSVGIKATDVEGKPSGADLASGTINGDGFTTNSTGDWYDIDLGSGASLSSGVKYAIVLGNNASGWARWKVNTHSNYGGGNSLTSFDSGSTWAFCTDGYDTGGGYDALFEEWGI